MPAPSSSTATGWEEKKSAARRRTSCLWAALRSLTTVVGGITERGFANVADVAPPGVPLDDGPIRYTAAPSHSVLLRLVLHWRELQRQREHDLQQP